MTVHKQALGRWGEAMAAKYLSQKGYAIIERNFRTEYGEIDLVAKIEQTVVFVEVKTRTTPSYGYPEEAITAEKMEHMWAAAQAYIQAHSEAQTDWRIDVIAIINLGKNSTPEITHFENVSIS
ncbi:MAG: YraN family protein [Anaerolineae bacterium]|nr:YraN family protein [Anaerolineae bacterium]